MRRDCSIPVAGGAGGVRAGETQRGYPVRLSSRNAKLAFLRSGLRRRLERGSEPGAAAAALPVAGIRRRPAAPSLRRSCKGSGSFSPSSGQADLCPSGWPAQLLGLPGKREPRGVPRVSRATATALASVALLSPAAAHCDPC